MKKFIRHPLDIRIECRLQDGEQQRKRRAENISTGGSSFSHAVAVPV